MTREERAYNYASKKNPSKFTVGEIAKHYDDGYTDGCKDAIDKVCEWLRTHINDYLVKGRDIDYMFDDFRKAMEEQQ